ncbi:MAG: thioredoxin-dependent thiol peroxidase [Candidatus Sumerlaeaceae bacterium]|jgi:peroxiredoxin Q/BCP
MTVEEGQIAPDFTLQASNGKPFTLSEERGKWVVLYFYPKDDTPGCTREACSFRDHIKQIQSLGATVVGVSPDDLRSHDRFAMKYHLPFLLLSDPEHEVAQLYDVWREKNMYGRKIFGIQRSTFLIAPDGRVHKAWRKVKVDHHVDEVLDELKLVAIN